MKHIKLFIFCVLAVFLANACDNGDLDITRSLEVSLNISDVIDFTPYNASDLEMESTSSKTAKVKVVTFIYGRDGSLQNEFTNICTDYSETCSFTTSLSGSDQTMVCFCYSFIGSPNSPDAQSFVISDKEKLSTLKVTKEDFIQANLSWVILGGYIGKIDDNAASLSVSLEPLGSPVYINFQKIHNRETSSSSPESYTFWSHSNDQVRVENGGFKYSTTLASDFYYIYNMKPSEHPSFNGVYMATFMMPGKFGIYGTIDYDSDNRNSFGKQDITTVAGKQYAILIDCSSLGITFREGSLRD